MNDGKMVTRYVDILLHDWIQVVVRIQKLRLSKERFESIDEFLIGKVEALQGGFWQWTWQSRGQEWDSYQIFWLNKRDLKQEFFGSFSKGFEVVPKVHSGGPSVSG